MKRLAIFGASGHGKVIAEIAELCGWTEVIFFDDDTNKNKLEKWLVSGNMNTLISKAINFDGCLVENSSKFAKKPYSIKPININIQCIQKLQKIISLELIITTSRPYTQKKQILNFLKKNNINYKSVITDLMHSKRILINDFANSNPYPSAIAVNISRNNTELSSILESIIYNG